jgi:Flp pilus assembly protein TadB
VAASAAWPGAESPVAWFWLVLVVAIALGIVGVSVHGLLVVLAVGVVVFVADLVLLRGLLKRRWRRPTR